MNAIKHPSAMRHMLYLLVTIALLLSACAAPAPAADQAAVQPTAEEAATEETAAEGATPEEAATEEVATEEAALAAAGECEEGFRYFDHELLATEPLCLPENPERVLPLDMASLEMTLLSGKTPVATAEWMLDEMPMLIPQFAEPLATLEGVGYPAGLEQVALLNPDLILGLEDTIDVAQASEIAPMVVADPKIYEDWKLGMEFWAAALNMSDRYVEMEENYLTRIGELQSELGDVADDEFSVVSFTAEGGPMLWMPDSAPGAILTDAGLTRTAAQSLVGDAATAEYGDKQWIQISEERMDLADGDQIFYFTYASTDPETTKTESDNIASVEQSALWQSLDGVAAGRSYLVGGHWWRSQTYYLANMVIDDLFANLTDTTATTPVLPLE